MREWDGGIVILASCKHHFVRANENLVQHYSNNISIFKNTIPAYSTSLEYVEYAIRAKKFSWFKLNETSFNWF